MLNRSGGAAPRIPELDGLRGIAILLILIGHYFAATAQPPPDSWLVNALYASRMLWSGVDLFFVLSGYLIGNILLTNAQAVNYFKVFYLRRICRIFPLYYLVLFSFFAVIVLGATSISPWLFNNPLPFLSYFTFTQNIAQVYWLAYFGIPAYGLGVTWSLAVEEQFYLFMPAVVRFFPRQRLFALLIGLILGALLLRLILVFAFSIGSQAAYVLTPTRIDSLLLGVLVALAMQSEKHVARLQDNIHTVRILAALIGGGLILLNILKQQEAASESRFMATIGYTLIGIFYACLLLIVLLRPLGAFAAALRNRALRWLGQVSYCVYLIHLLVLGLCHGWLLRQAPRWSNLTELGVTLLALAITLLLAKASWDYFEQPLINRGRSFHYQKTEVTVS